MQLIRDFYLVSVDKIFESTTTPSGVISSNTATIDANQEDRGYYKRRYGTVLEVPVTFSKDLVTIIDPGSPQPRRFVGHEYIQKMINIGYPEKDFKNRYYPSTFENYATITKSDISKMVNAQVGDRIYFMEQATDEDRFMGMHNGKYLFSISVDEIQMVVKKKHVFLNHEKHLRHSIHMQGPWVLCEPDMEDWEDITTPEGILMKVAPGADWQQVVDDDGKTSWQMNTTGKPLRGVVKAVRDGKQYGVGDTVIFMRDADAPITVEGKEYTIIQEEDILAKIRRVKSNNYDKSNEN